MQICAFRFVFAFAYVRAILKRFRKALWVVNSIQNFKALRQALVPCRESSWNSNLITMRMAHTVTHARKPGRVSMEPQKRLDNSSSPTLLYTVGPTFIILRSLLKLHMQQNLVEGWIKQNCLWRDPTDVLTKTLKKDFDNSNYQVELQMNLCIERIPSFYHHSQDKIKNQSKGK